MNSHLPSHGGNLNEEARRLGVKASEILDASASLVPFPPPKALKNCLIKACTTNSLRNYPDRSHEALKEVISNWHQVHSSMVLPGNGAAELFTWAARDAKNTGLSCLPTPGFSDYSRALRCWDASYINLPLPLSWSSEKPQPFPLEPPTNVLWITNPHNPTGQLWSRQSIEPLLAKQDLVICDEAFLPLVPKGENESLLPLVSQCPNLVVIRSLTKLFGIAGLRLGYAIGSNDRLRKWNQWRDPWPLNSLAIDAGVTLLGNTSALKKWIMKVQHWVKEEGVWLQTNLKKIPGITPYPSAANFLLIKGQFSLMPLREKLAHRNILLRECQSFEELGERYLRISFQNRRGNQRIIKGLQDLLR